MNPKIHILPSFSRVSPCAVGLVARSEVRDGSKAACEMRLVAIAANPPNVGVMDRKSRQSREMAHAGHKMSTETGEGFDHAAPKGTRLPPPHAGLRSLGTKPVKV